MKLAPRVYYTANANSARVAEAIQGYLRKIGVDWRLQPVGLDHLARSRWPSRTTKSGR